MSRKNVVALFRICNCLSPLRGDEEKQPTFDLGPDSMRQDGIPRGKVARHEWRSTILDGNLAAVVSWYLYVPAQYDGAKPAPSQKVPGRPLLFKGGNGRLAGEGYR